MASFASEVERLTLERAADIARLACCFYLTKETLADHCIATKEAIADEILASSKPLAVASSQGGEQG